MERKEMEVQDVSLEEEDYEGENEDIIRVSPESMQMQTEEPEE